MRNAPISATPPRGDFSTPSQDAPRPPGSPRQRAANDTLPARLARRPPPLTLQPGAGPHDAPAGAASPQTWFTPRSQLSSPSSSTSAPSSPSSLSSLSSPSSLPSPSWPSTPPSPASPASPTSPLFEIRHPADGAPLALLADAFAEDVAPWASLRVPNLPPCMDRDALVDVHEFLQAHAALPDPHQARAAQEHLRELLARGNDAGVPPRQLAEWQALARADLDTPRQALARLRNDFAQLRRYVMEEQGGSANLLTRRAPTRQELDARREAALAEHQAALDAGYGIG